MVQSNGRALLKRIVCASGGSKLPAAIEFDEFDLPYFKKEDKLTLRGSHIFKIPIFLNTSMVCRSRRYAGPGRPGQLYGCAVFLLPRSSLAIFFCDLAFLLFSVG